MAEKRGEGAAWPQIQDILINHAGNRPDPTARLVGQELIVRLEDGGELVLWFVSPDFLQWSLGGRDVSAQPYQAFEVRSDCYFVDFVDAANELRSYSLWLDLRAERALLVEGSIEDRSLKGADLLSRIAQSGSQSLAKLQIRSGSLSWDGAIAVYPRSTAILGRFLRYTYSDTHVYDHYYASPDYYHWHCWSGPDAGLGEFDEVRCLDLAHDLFLVCWAEKLLPCMAVTIEDHRSMRSIGKIFGADNTTWTTGNATVGARMTLITKIEPLTYPRRSEFVVHREIDQ